MILLCFGFHVFTEGTELSSDGKMRYYTADTESFFVNSYANTTVRVTDGIVEQKEYDELQRLTKTIVWSADAKKIEKISQWFYDSDLSVVKKLVTEDFLVMKHIEKTFDTNKNCIQEKSYTLFQQELLQDGQSNKKLEYTKIHTYNSLNKILATKTVYEDASLPSEKIEYKYLVDENIANSYLYKDDVLQKSIVYSTVENWEETVFFEDSLNIVTFYEDFTATKEVVYKYGKKIRETEL